MPHRAAFELLGIEPWELRHAPREQPRVERPATLPSTQALPPGDVRAAPQPAATAPPPRILEPAAGWDELFASVGACVSCGLHAGRTNTVFGVGDRRADWLVVGEAPGAEEDLRGEPFVGRAGGLLNAMLRALDLTRESVFIANVLKCRPPRNRDPRPEEVASCLPFLRRQIELLNPRIILVVGRIAAQNLLGTDAPIGRLRGQVHVFGEARTPLVVTYHPAYLLRAPAEKRKAWDDLKLARRVHASLSTGAEAT